MRLSSGLGVVLWLPPWWLRLPRAQMKMAEFWELLLKWVTNSLHME